MFLLLFIYITLGFLTSNYTNADANLRNAFFQFSKLTNQFLATIQPYDGLNLSLSLLPQFLGKQPFNNNSIEYINLLWQTYIGYFIMIVFGVSFIVIFTLVGLCFCMCRCCCNRCGAKPPGPSATNLKKKRVVLSIFLFLLVTMMMIGAVLSMASNIIFLDAIKVSNTTNDKAGNVFTNVDTIIQGVISFINYIANNGFTAGYGVLQRTLSNIVSTLSSTVTLFINTFLAQLNYLQVINGTNAMINLYTSMTSASQNLANAATLHNSTTNLFVNYLSTVVQNLSSLLNQTQCQPFQSNCQDIANLLPSLVLAFNVSNINYTVDQNAPNIMNSYNISNMSSARDTFLENAKNITNQINATVIGYVQEFSNYLTANSVILQTYNNTVSQKDTLISYILTLRNMLYYYPLDGSNSVSSNVIYNYYQYVFYGLTILIGLILLIVLLFFVGLCFGMCGGPNFEDSPCCSKGKGRGFLMGSIAFSYIFGWLIMLIVMILFLVGGLSQTEGCSYFVNSSPSKPISTIDAVINSSLSLLNISFPINNTVISLPNINYVQSLINNCPSSTDLVKAFSVPSYYISYVSSVFYQEFVSSYLTILIQQIRNYNFPNLDMSVLLNQTNNIGSVFTVLNGIDKTMTVTELRKPVLVLNNVNAFLNSIFDLALIANNSDPQYARAINDTVQNMTAMVNSMQAAQTSYLQQKSGFIASIVTSIKNYVILDNMLSSLPSKISDAQTTAIQVANVTLVQNVSSVVNQTVFDIITSLGHCRDLSKIANVTINTVCNVLLVPFNNIWMGMGWFLLFIIPSIILGLKLHRLYGISHIETVTSKHGKAYQNSNHFLSEADMAKIRSRKYESHA